MGVICILAIYWIYRQTWKPTYNTCDRIILDAEKRLLSEGSEPNQPQEPTNTPQQAQENLPSRSGNRGQIEYTKAMLDFLKLLASATLAAMFLISIYNLQTAGTIVLRITIHK